MGHWEGATLVVDTTNFREETNFRGASKNFHLVERFTRVADDKSASSHSVAPDRENSVGGDVGPNELS